MIFEPAKLPTSNEIDVFFVRTPVERGTYILDLVSRRCRQDYSIQTVAVTGTVVCSHFPVELSAECYKYSAEYANLEPDLFQEKKPAFFIVIPSQNGSR